MILLMPWGEDDSDGPTVNMPAEYFLLLPLVGHRRLFGGALPQYTYYMTPPGCLRRCTACTMDARAAQPV